MYTLNTSYLYLFYDDIIVICTLKIRMLGRLLLKSISLFLPDPFTSFQSSQKNSLFSYDTCLHSITAYTYLTSSKISSSVQGWLSTWIKGGTLVGARLSLVHACAVHALGHCTEVHRGTEKDAIFESIGHSMNKLFLLLFKIFRTKTWH